MKTKIFGALILSAATMLLLGCNQDNSPPAAAPVAATPAPAAPPAPESTPAAPEAPAPAPAPAP
jgi:PBP1b-binding outer membrane lipoprotein LpoB